MKKLIAFNLLFVFSATFAHAGWRDAIGGASRIVNDAVQIREHAGQSQRSDVVVVEPTTTTTTTSTTSEQNTETAVTAEPKKETSGNSSTLAAKPNANQKDTQEKFDNSPQAYKFLEAAREGDLDKVKSLLSEGLSINLKVSDGRRNDYITAIGTAAATCKWVVVKYLADNGADVNVFNNGEIYRTPVRYAASDGRWDIVEYLLDKGAVDFWEEDHGGLLHYAIRGGAFDIVKKFVEANKVDINFYKDGDNQNISINEAIANKKWGIAKYLVNKNVKLNINYFGRCEFSGMSTLALAICIGEDKVKLNFLELLIEKGADVCAVNTILGANTVLHYAAISNRADIVNLLVDKGAKLNEKNDKGFTPISAAAKAGRWNAVIALAQRKADLNIKDKDGETVLHVAAPRCTLEVMKFLVENGGNVNAIGKNNKNVLHYALESGGPKLDVIKYLVDKGANTEEEDADGNTPLDVAKANGQIEVVEFLSSVKK